MSSISTASLYGLIFGLIGTSIGGFIGSFLSLKSKKILSFILELSAGLMTSIICFDLIPESILNANILITIAGILTGSLFMYLINLIVDNKLNNLSHLFKTGIIIFIGLSMHNLPEGLAIGSGFISSQTLGFSLCFAIALHDIPEGMTISIPLVSSGFSKTKAFIFATLSGLTTGIGAFLGATISNINETFISFSLSIAAGTMLYIISHELIYESKKIYIGSFPTFGFILGIILGLFIFI